MLRGVHPERSRRAQHDRLNLVSPVMPLGCQRIQPLAFNSQPPGSAGSPDPRLTEGAPSSDLDVVQSENDIGRNQQAHVTTVRTNSFRVIALEAEATTVPTDKVARRRTGDHLSVLSQRVRPQFIQYFSKGLFSFPRRIIHSQMQLGNSVGAT